MIACCTSAAQRSQNTSATSRPCSCLRSRRKSWNATYFSIFGFRNPAPLHPRKKKRFLQRNALVLLQRGKILALPHLQHKRFLRLNPVFPLPPPRKEEKPVIKQGKFFPHSPSPPASAHSCARVSHPHAYFSSPPRILGIPCSSRPVVNPRFKDIGLSRPHAFPQSVRLCFPPSFPSFGGYGRR